MKFKAFSIFAMSVLFAGGAFAADTRPSSASILVDFRLENMTFVEGERIRGLVDIANSSSDKIDVGNVWSDDSVIVELFRSSDRHLFSHTGTKPFVAPFSIGPGQGQKLEVFLADHYPFVDATHYYARAVLVHRGVRYESQYRAFDIVPGIHVTSGTQLFASDKGLRREFEIVHWTRNRLDHLFLKTKDVGSATRRWGTVDLGALMRVNDPKLSILESGRVVVLHRATQDTFIRTEFWSLPTAFEAVENEEMIDPAVAGVERMKRLYSEADDVTPVKKVWWKFW